MAKGLSEAQLRAKVDEMTRIFRSAVRKAQEENRRLGIPNVYSINGHIYHEMPNGDMVRQDKEGDERAASGPD